MNVEASPETSVPETGQCHACSQCRGKRKDTIRWVPVSAEGQDSDVMMHSKTLPRSIILRHVRNGWQSVEQKLIASLLPLTEAIQCVENGKFEFQRVEVRYV